MPLFFEHTGREADRFAARFAGYSKRQIEFEVSTRASSPLLDPTDEVLDFKTEAGALR